MRTTIARVLGALRALVVPDFRSPGSPVWHVRWPWGTIQCWRRGDSNWSIGKGKNVGLYINLGRIEAWTARRRKGIPSRETIEMADHILNHYDRNSRADKICLARRLENWKRDRHNAKAEVSE